ncbi:thioredoxin family protein [Aminipila terrae]
MMGLFGFGKNKEVKNNCDCGCSSDRHKVSAEDSSCCCGGDCNAETMAAAEIKKTAGSSVKVLGSGCAKCNQLETATKEALEELGMDTSIDHVTDFVQIASYGVMTTPALVIDGKVVSFGKVLKKDDVINILKKVRV